MITGWLAAFPIGVLTNLVLHDKVPGWVGIAVAGCLGAVGCLITMSVGLP